MRAPSSSALTRSRARLTSRIHQNRPASQQQHPDTSTMLPPLPQAQAWSTPSLCPLGALPSPSRGRVGSQWPEMARESDTEGRAPTGIWPRRWLARGQTARTVSLLDPCKRTRTSTLPHRWLARGQTARPAPLQGPSHSPSGHHPVLPSGRRIQ
jgi:hypothetical protein